MSGGKQPVLVFGPCTIWRGNTGLRYFIDYNGKPQGFRFSAQEAYDYCIAEGLLPPKHKPKPPLPDP